MKKHKIFVTLVLAPILIWFSVFVLYPILYEAFASLHLWVPSKPFGSVFVGLSNYIQLFTKDERFQISMINTLKYVAIKTVFAIAISFFISLILEKVKKLQKLYIYLIFLPILCSATAIGILFMYLYQPRFGLFNEILKNLGIPGQGFLTDPKQALYCVIAADIWQYLGFSTLIFYTGLINIPDVFSEAARVDGANPFKKLIHITIPLLGHTFLFMFIITIINAFQVFDFIFVMTGSSLQLASAGGPGTSTYVMSLLVYNEGVLRSQIDKASATAIILFLIVLILTILQLRFLKPKWEY
ncbi:MAG: sugar ABC transporter permease [Actinobacteria bacterium]|nr:sugar ABC transporter permease [Actinomycetota bacterium]